MALNIQINIKMRCCPSANISHLTSYANVFAKVV